MFTHIVICEPKEVRAFNVRRDRTAGVEGSASIGYTSPWIHRQGEEEPDYNTLRNIEIVLAESEAHANDAAKIMAVSHPNRNVYVAKTSALLMSKPSTPTMSIVSEKGVVPK